MTQGTMLDLDPLDVLREAMQEDPSPAEAVTASILQAMEDDAEDATRASADPDEDAPTRAEVIAAAVATGAEIEPANDSPFENAMALRLELCCFGTSRRGVMGEIKTDADKGMLRLGKAIVESAALDAIHSADGAIRRWLEDRSVPAPLFKSGTRLVKFTSFDDVDAKIFAYVSIERPRLVDRFIEDWPRAVDDARRRLGPQFEAKNYPEPGTVREAFRGRRQWLEIGAPKALQRLSIEQYNRQAAEIRESFAEAMEAARAGLRVKVRDLVAKLAERLTPAADGKRKVFRDSAVENAREFFDLFDGCDLTNDAATRAIVERGRRLLAGVQPDDLRADSADKERERLAREFATLETQLDAMITTQGRVYGEDY